MSAKTSIEWCAGADGRPGASWNPIRARNRGTGKTGWHCEHVHEGCRRCYAEAMNRWLGTGLDFKPGNLDQVELFLDEKILLEPLKWKEPRKVFVCSMTDLFGRWVEDWMIARIWSVMACCPHLTFIVLTKRPERQRALLTGEAFCTEANAFIEDLAFEYSDPLARRSDDLRATAPDLDPAEPLPNVWAGTSCSTQEDADKMIPELLTMPAAKRIVSLEPLLGPINIRAALRPMQPFIEQDLPERWDAFSWPEWVPADVRARVQEFWREQWGRGPRAWLRSAITQGGPALWTLCNLHNLTIGGPTPSGRFVHLWNNIGCVVHDDGTFSRGSFTGSGVYRAVISNGRGLDWVIAGGESGDDARPMHPDWARGLRDQCAAAGVPFFFKQWGEWAPHRMQPGGDLGGDVRAGRVRIVHPTGQSDVEVAEATGGRSTISGSRYMARIGKKAAGRLLDGIEHSEFPA